MRLRTLLGALLICLGLLTLMPAAQADTVDNITFALTPADLSGTPGSVLTWTYSLTLLDGTVVTNSASVSRSGLVMTGTAANGAQCTAVLTSNN